MVPQGASEWLRAPLRAAHQRRSLRMEKRKSSHRHPQSIKRHTFEAEAAYAQSIFRSALGDQSGSIAALEQARRWDPLYAPAILSMGSVMYQRGDEQEGRELFASLITLPTETPDLAEVIDEAGTFLIQMEAYKDGLDLYRAAVERFPDVGVLHQGRGCCAGHEGLHAEAVEASRRALEIEPDNQKYVNDLGWCLLEAGRAAEAEALLRRAVTMDPADELARGNLRICQERISRDRRKDSAPSRRADRRRARPRPR